MRSVPVSFNMWIQQGKIFAPSSSEMFLTFGLIFFGLFAIVFVLGELISLGLHHSTMSSMMNNKKRKRELFPPEPEPAPSFKEEPNSILVEPGPSTSTTSGKNTDCANNHPLTSPSTSGGFTSFQSEQASFKKVRTQSQIQPSSRKERCGVEVIRVESSVFDGLSPDHRISIENITDEEIQRQLQIFESYDDVSDYPSDEEDIFEFEELGLTAHNGVSEAHELFSAEEPVVDPPNPDTNGDMSTPTIFTFPLSDPCALRTWKEDDTIDQSLSFQQRTGLQTMPNGVDPYSFFQLLVTDQFLEHIVQETNKQAEYVYLVLKKTTSKSLILDWKTLTVPEFKIFLGLLFLSGIVSQSRMKDHWSTVKHYNGIFRTPTFPENMARDRFFMILWCLHFATNPREGEPAPQDRLYKIRYIIDYFNDKMMEVYCPSKELGIDESNVLWRGRLAFRQYNPQKRHKYGMKLYSLTEPNGLALKILLYAGAADPEVGGEGHANKVVLKLMKEFLNQGRSLYMDNYYNSVLLAATLKNHETYVTGTLRADRVGNPSDVKSAKLKKGEVIQRFSNDGICVMKWKDKRDIMMISTEADGELVSTTNRLGVEKQKPKAVGIYNKNMQGTDQCDQLLAYYPSERKTLKWYRKLGIHIINMLMNNSYMLYKRCGDKRCSQQYDYRAEVILSLLETDFPKPATRILPTPPRFRRKVVTEHFPRQKKDSNMKGRNYMQMRCRQCQAETTVVKKTRWFCSACPDEPGLCHEPCFEKWHKNVFVDD